MFTEEAVESYVSVKLTNNAFNDSNYVVRVPFTTVSTNGIITEIANSYPSINPYVIQHSLELVKAKILELLKQGRSVDVLELGTLYLKPDSTVTKEDPSVTDMPKLKVAFRVNSETKNALSDVSVNSFMINDPSPVIGTVTSLYDGNTNGTLYQDSAVLLKGSNLKLPESVINGGGGEEENESGVYFVPVLDTGDPNPDETTWKKVTGYYSKNTETYLQFSQPPSGVTLDADYFIAVKTNYLSSTTYRKSYIIGYTSEMVAVVAQP